jgi:hypothetical protein
MKRLLLRSAYDALSRWLGLDVAVATTRIATSPFALAPGVLAAANGDSVVWSRVSVIHVRLQ